MTPTPLAQQVSVLTLAEGSYEAEAFDGAAEIASTRLAELAPAKGLTAAQVLNL